MLKTYLFHLTLSLSHILSLDFRWGGIGEAGTVSIPPEPLLLSPRVFAVTPVVGSKGWTYGTPQPEGTLRARERLPEVVHS